MAMLNHLGICKGVKGTTAVVDSVRREFDSKLQKWKTKLADSLVESRFNLRDRKSAGVAVENSSA